MKMAVQTKYYVKKVCNFCKEKKEPDYKDVDMIKKLTTERGKILSRARSGVCAAHQKKLATSIKRARNLALLPFVPKI